MSDNTPKKGFFSVVGGAIVTAVVWVAKQSWALVSDYEWNFDAYKATGFVAFGFAGWLALQVVDLTKSPNPNISVVGIVGGLVTAFITVGTFLFSHARTNDATLAGKQGGA